MKEGPGLTCPAGLPVPRGTVLTRSVLRSAAVLIILTLLVTGLNLWWTARQENAFQASQRQEQQARQRAGETVEAKLCSTFGKLAALKPPPGDPARNPSRAFLQSEHDTLVQLGADLGCRGAGR